MASTVTCEECRKVFSPWDEEHRTWATAISVPDALVASGWDRSYYFCSPNCLHKFSDPDKG